jgi:RimJ/RimL family protein N-acetyltransferase
VTLTLTTARLTLRPHVADDFAPFAAFMASDRSRFFGGPRETDRAWDWFASDVAQWPLYGWGGLAVMLAERLIGQVSIIRPPRYAEPELGWFCFSPADEGQGYFTEAARALRDWALGPRGLPTLVSYMNPANARSVAMAERLGARRDTDAACPPGTICYRHGGTA